MSAIIAFLLDRYDEEEALIRAVQPLQMTGYHGDALDIVSVYRHRQRGEDGAAYSVADRELTSLLRHLSPERLLADLEAKRAIVAAHLDWPVLVEGPLENTAEPRFDDVIFSLRRQMEWVTEQEYIKKFGTEAPTGRMMLALVQPYSQHPDFYPAWRLS